MDFLLAAILGIIEGLTEFLPVSSTAHLLLAAKALNFHATGDAFEVLIQFGAILAIVVLYFRKLWDVLISLPSSEESQRFAISVLIATLPAIGLGLGLHHFIKGLFERLDLICYDLIIGGIILWAVDKWAPPPVVNDPMKISPVTALIIGMFQCLAIIFPGASRSGSTLIGALLFRVEKKAALEFSFFMAIPAMFGAFILDFIKSYKRLHGHDLGLIGVGFVVSFITALLVIKPFLNFVSKQGYGLFAWWRVIVGGGGLIWLWLSGALFIPF